MQSVSVVGTWKLISAKADNPKGDVIYPYGENPFGILMYDTNGYMSVLIMRIGRSKFGSGDPFAGTPEEIKEAFEGFDAYCGTYEVNVEKETITHRIRGSRFPNWEGTDQVRYFELSDNRLILKTPPIPSLETEWVVSLTWDLKT